MMGMFCCMIEYLTYGTKEGPTNDDSPSHARGCVQITSIVFVSGECRALVLWWGCVRLRVGRVDEMVMEDSLDEGWSTRFGDRWSCRACDSGVFASPCTFVDECFNDSLDVACAL